MIMGIDQSLSSTGLIILNNDKIQHFEVIKTSKNISSIFERFNIISNHIIDLIFKYNCAIINIEGIPFGRIPGNASRDLAGLQAVIISKILEQTTLVCNIIPPKAVKKFATDNGNASKVEMLESLPNEIKHLFKSKNYKKSTGLYDLTDAYYIAIYK